MTFGTRKHCGGLKESLKTSKEITKEEFISYIACLAWEYYGYDERVNQLLWINLNYKDFQWLFIQL